MLTYIMTFVKDTCLAFDMTIILTYMATNIMTLDVTGKLSFSDDH